MSGLQARLPLSGDYVAVRAPRIAPFQSNSEKVRTVIVQSMLALLSCVHDHHGDVVPPTPLERELDQGLAGVGR